MKKVVAMLVGFLLFVGAVALMARAVEWVREDAADQRVKW